MPQDQHSLENVNLSDNPPELNDRRMGRLIPLLSLTGVFGVIFLISAITNHGIQFFLLSASFFLTFVIGILSTLNLFHAPAWVKVFLFTFLLEVSIALLSAVYPSFSGIPYAVIAISIAFLLSTFIPRSGSSDWIITLGIIGAIASFLTNVISPFPQTNNPMVSGIVAAFALLFSIWTIGLFVRSTLVATIRTKLILGSLALTLIPLVILSIINNRYLQTSMQNQVNQSLSVASGQIGKSIDDFFATHLDSVVNTASNQLVRNYLQLNPNLRQYSAVSSDLGAAFRALQATEPDFYPSYAILDLSGQNIYDTKRQNAGVSESATSYFQAASSSGTSFVSPVEFLPDNRESYIAFIAPVKDAEAMTIGYLRTRYDARIFQDMIEENVGILGFRSYPILVDENGIRLADGYLPDQIYHSVTPLTDTQYSQLLSEHRIPATITPENIAISQTDFSKALSAPPSNPYFITSMKLLGADFSFSGVVKKINSRPWTVILLQDRTNLISSLAEQNRISTTISAIIAGMVGILITVVANVFSAPIIRLTEAAEKISTGNFEVEARITSNDEIGVLGKSFNSMTRQVKELIDNLENRVRERTQKLVQQNESLQFRSRQLQTVSDVARSIVSTRELDTLLTTVTRLVSERFGFYHAGIFLLDPSGEYAVLRAANSEGGKRMLARQHRLRVGQVGIVGYAAGTGEPRIATDVGEDAVFFNNPDLPETKSEMALPLKLGDRIIGALDVQSTESNAFSAEDIELFSTLSDQIAIAINNSQLYEETSRALEESQNLYRQYLRQEWKRQNIEVGNRNYKFTPDGLVPFEEELPEINMVLNTTRPVFRTQKSITDNNETHSVMAVPIILNNESIGAIYLKESSDKQYVWSQSELSTVQAVADQVAQTLENARLFEQTIRRADRERKVLEITSKIRSTNDPQEMLMITLEELKRNLGVKQAQIVLNIDHQSIPDAPEVESTGSESTLPNEGAASL